MRHIRDGWTGTVVASESASWTYVRPDRRLADGGLHEVRDPTELEHMGEECCPTCHHALAPGQAATLAIMGLM